MAPTVIIIQDIPFHPVIYAVLNNMNFVEILQFQLTDILKACFEFHSLGFSEILWHANPSPISADVYLIDPSDSVS